MSFAVAPARRVRGAVRVPGDKSIGHRALLFGALAEGTTRIDGLPDGEDVAATRRCLEALGVAIQDDGDEAIEIEGSGGTFSAPSGALDCGNSGTTMRLLAGILASHAIDATLDGDASLRGRPMDRVASPLRTMGAHIDLAPGGVAPMRVQGSADLRAIAYSLPVASAQLKSSLVLAALGAHGLTTLGGALHSRDHTERMLPAFGGRLERRAGTISIDGGQRLRAASVRVPGDFSSAAYWIAAGAILPDSRVEILDVGLNPTRTGFLDVLRRMGASIEVRVERHSPEPVGTIVVESSPLHATDVNDDEVPALIDELPLLAVVAAFAAGTTFVRGAQELRVKESDRIEAVIRNGTALGMQIEGFPDGFAVEGHARLSGAEIDAMHDHRIAMAFAVAALGARGATTIRGATTTAVSYPAFWSTLEKLGDG